MLNRVIIEAVRPEVDGGRYPAKRVVGEQVLVTADIFADGHDVVRASLFYKKASDKIYTHKFMTATSNDAWEASFKIEEQENYTYYLEAWIDHLATWFHGFQKKQADGQDMSVELQIGAAHLKATANATTDKKAQKALTDAAKKLSGKDIAEATKYVLSRDFAELLTENPLKPIVTKYQELTIKVERKKALFSTWYELFPRSASRVAGQHGTFNDVVKLLPRIAEMGFDVLYLPPIHPIGREFRKAKNGTLDITPTDPGSCWAIGAKEGGHKAIHPELGTLADYKKLIKEAKALGIEIALDIALQCAPDHPYIKEHPNWFVWRPDGTIAYAENPPKKYQDIVPLNFECEDWKNMWEELKSIVTYWVAQGVNVFRVDNPHTKSIRFWEWCIDEVHKESPDVIFLSEAFTRPKVMKSLGKSGYTQGYTYFTWRNTKKELEQYLTELTTTELRDTFRPNFWPNTPDILPYFLQSCGPNGFHLKYALAATLSSNVGMYGPVYEFYEERAIPKKEEYMDSEKFEIKFYDWERKTRMTELITQINTIRKNHPALQTTYNIRFTRTTNDMLISYVKWSDDLKDVIWCVVNLDPMKVQSGHVETPRELLGLDENARLYMHDLLSGERYAWGAGLNFVELNPYKSPAHIMSVEPEGPHTRVR